MFVSITVYIAVAYKANKHKFIIAQLLAAGE